MTAVPVWQGVRGTLDTILTIRAVAHLLERRAQVKVTWVTVVDRQRPSESAVDGMVVARPVRMTLVTPRRGWLRLDRR